MTSYVEQRLKELRGELEIGQKQLAALDARASDLKVTLFRIGGAIQVLEDVLAHAHRTSEQSESPTGPAFSAS